MSRLKVATIVEGHGEVSSVPILLERLWYELIGGEYIEVVRPPIRQPRDKLAKNKDDALVDAVNLAAAKLGATDDTHAIILVLIDTNSDQACKLAPQMLEWAQYGRRDKDVACVLATIWEAHGHRGNRSLRRC